VSDPYSWCILVTTVLRQLGIEEDMLVRGAPVSDVRLERSAKADSRLKCHGILPRDEWLRRTYGEGGKWAKRVSGQC